MRKILIALMLSLGVAMPTLAAVSVSIGINVPTYPTLVRIPSYPVYYAPAVRTNFFFHDGLYWVFHDGIWYESPWYNGPWYAVDPYDVPVYLLRVPVRYYRVAPAYFRMWAHDKPPHWGDVWGSSWHMRRAGWDRWNRASVPAPAPLPEYQRSYSGSSYPSVTQQASIQTQSYPYLPIEAVVRQRFDERRVQAKAVSPQPARTVTQAPQQQRERPQQQAQRREPAARPAQQQRQERAQPGPERAPRTEQPDQRAERQQQKESKGREKGKGKDPDEG